MAGPAKRWPDRSQAMPKGVPVALATFSAAAPQSSHVAVAPGMATPAWSNSDLLTIGPVTVSWVARP